MDSGQRHKYIQQLLKLASDPERKRLASDLFSDHSVMLSSTNAPPPEKKLWKFWGSTPIWGGIGVLAGYFASQVSLKLLFVAVWGLFVFEFVRVGFFARTITKAVGNLVVAGVFAALFFGLYRISPKPKESPSLDQQADVVIDKAAKKFPWLTSPPKQIDTLRPAVLPPIVIAGEPKLQFSVKHDRTIVLNNSKGSDLEDFRINALDYHLDGRAFINDHAVVQAKTIIGGDIDFKHFDVRAGEIKHVSPTENIRYGFLLNMNKPTQDALQNIDNMTHYICLRFVFNKKDTGETWVHYVVLSPYGDPDKFDYIGEPESASGQMGAGGEGFPSSIARNIKADARNFYGTEYREYQP